MPSPNLSSERLLKMILDLRSRQDALESSTSDQVQTSYGFSPKTSKNGHQEPNNTLNDQSYQSISPIGYYTAHQRAEMKAQAKEVQNFPVHTCTGLYRDKLIDRHTVEHVYQKNGETKLVHYSMGIINSRIAQYERETKEAESRGLAVEVLQNRKNKLAYWRKKKQELIAKNP